MPSTDPTLPGVTILQTNSAGHICDARSAAGVASFDVTTLKWAAGCRLIDTVTSIEYINSGTAAAPVWTRVASSAVVDPKLIQFVEVDLAAADLIATAAGKLSHANGLIVVPAAPTGYVNSLVKMVVSYTFATAAFTGGGNTTVNIGGGGAALSGLIATGSLWQSGSNVVYEFKPLSTVATPMTKEQSINLVTASAITNPGTAAGSAKVYCWYQQLPI